MKNIKLLSFIWLIGLVFLTISCVEEIDVKTLTFEDALVVEGTITNEYKFHEIKLSRTYKLEEDGPAFEREANISIIDDIGNTYSFQEDTPGVYISDIEFKAIPEREYQLKISTSTGKSYSSSSTKLTAESKIDEISASREINENDIEGISIKVNSFNAERESNYYRYEFEETYKIIAPHWSEYDISIVSEVPPYEFELVPRTKEERVCYNTIFSAGIIQTETNNLSEDRVSNFQVRFIEHDDFIISYRYSVLVKQYVQSLEAYTFYNILNSLSGSESLFSQNQPGYFNGNIVSENNVNEKVIGFFEVSSVSTKRIFINPRDLIKTKPDFIAYCELVAPFIEGSYGETPLIDGIKDGSLKFVRINDPEGPADLIVPGGPYQMVRARCGDCTTMGTNIEPDFWEE